MVAIVFLLVMVVSIPIFASISKAAQDEPLASFKMDQDGLTAILTHAGGDTFDGENLYVVSDVDGDLGNYAGTDGQACDSTISTVDPGVSCDVSDTAGEWISVVWRSNGRSVTVFREWVPEPPLADLPWYTNHDIWQIEAEHFDEGGQGVAYNDDSSANVGGAFRMDEGVDIESADDTTGTYNVGWINDSEWTEYTIDPNSGTYDIHFRVASSNDDGTLTAFLDSEKIGSVDPPNTGNWQEYETVTINDVSVDGGPQVLRLEYSSTVRDDKLYNLNWIGFRNQSPYTTHDIRQIEAENFDDGGQGVAYHDESSGNAGGAFRTDEDIDIESTSDVNGTYNVGWINDGEWLEYTIDPDSGTYNLQFRVASTHSDTSITAYLDGEKIDTVDVPDTGGWQSWETVTIKDVNVDSGTQVLRLESSGPHTHQHNINWVGFK